LLRGIVQGQRMRMRSYGQSMHDLRSIREDRLLHRRLLPRRRRISGLPGLRPGRDILLGFQRVLQWARLPRGPGQRRRRSFLLLCVRRDSVQSPQPRAVQQLDLHGWQVRLRPRELRVLPVVGLLRLKRVWRNGKVRSGILRKLQRRRLRRVQLGFRLLRRSLHQRHVRQPGLPDQRLRLRVRFGLLQRQLQRGHQRLRQPLRRRWAAGAHVPSLASRVAFGLAPALR
jgi:hypothetical protein